MMLQFGASLTDDTRSVNYDRNTFTIQATDLKFENLTGQVASNPFQLYYLKL